MSRDGSQTFAWDRGHSLPPEIQGLACFFLRLTKKPPLLCFYSRTAEMRRGGGQILPGAAVQALVPVGSLLLFASLCGLLLSPRACCAHQTTSPKAQLHGEALGVTL